MKKILVFAVVALALVQCKSDKTQPQAYSTQWQADILGDGYEMRYVDQGEDYSGPVRSTIIRKQSPCGSNRGILYVHGYNDYFFQSEMGDRLVDSCYNFYAVDLRKYGRSLMDGQTKFEVRDLHEYFADIDSALAAMHRDGIDDIVLMAHSTGGLITSMYMEEEPDPAIQEFVLNSPFLEWNLGGGMKNVVIPTVRFLSPVIRNVKFSNGNSTAYAESLLADHHGEWTYNTDWKTFYPERVSAAWLAAIDKGHSQVQKAETPIEVPILLMHSDRSIYGDEWMPEFQTGDAVLNVEDISRYGRALGPNVTEYIAPGGLHDLILSTDTVRSKVYDEIFRFLNE
ncbi:MAG: alpha/beta hydrolase [Bacteroidales bacterium]|nr:alpha/beta hydrolase [Bacteroidales bacterium]